MRVSVVVRDSQVREPMYAGKCGSTGLPGVSYFIKTAPGRQMEN